jgi:DNA-binding LacI/PurR family transcriptional regulator
MAEADKNITMAEIARRCRLSKATVSRALSLPPDKSPVNAKTRERIIRLAQGVGYRPNWRARAFSRRRTRTVGLIISGLLPQHEAIPHQILEGFTRVLRDSGYHLSLVPVDGAMDWRDLAFGGHVDGCATINDPSPDVVAELGRTNMPVVAMNASPHIQLPVVTVDDVDGGQQIGRYLRDLGHRRVAMYVNEDAVPHYSHESRLRGLGEGLRGGAEIGDLSVQFIRDSHDRAMVRLLDQQSLPTAIVCYSHYEAIPLLKGLSERKISVPEQISVATFNDVFPLDCMIPPITTIAIPADKIGILAARQLLKQIQEGKQSEVTCRILPESLIVRQSCAVARDGKQL